MGKRHVTWLLHFKDLNQRNANHPNYKGLVAVESLIIEIFE